jgi:hypothetical protein
LTSIFSTANVAIESLPTLPAPAIANPIPPVARVAPQPATGATKTKGKKKKVKRTQEKLQFPRKKPRTSAAGKSSSSSSKARSKPPQSALREVTNMLSTSRTPVNLLGRFHGAQSLHNNRATCSLSPQARVLLTERVRELEEEENLVPAGEAPATRAPTPIMRHRAAPAAASTSHHAVPSASATADTSFARGPRAILPGASVPGFVPRHRAPTPTSGPVSTASPGRRAVTTAAPSATGVHAIAPGSCLNRCHRTCCRFADNTYQWVGTACGLSVRSRSDPGKLHAANYNKHKPSPLCTTTLRGRCKMVPFCRWEAKQQSGQRHTSSRASLTGGQEAEEWMDLDTAGDAGAVPGTEAAATLASLDQDMPPRTAEVAEAAPSTHDARPTHSPGGSEQDWDSDVYEMATDVSDEEMVHGGNGTGFEEEDNEDRRSHYGPLFSIRPRKGPDATG